MRIPFPPWPLQEAGEAAPSQVLSARSRGPRTFPERLRGSRCLSARAPLRAGSSGPRPPSGRQEQRTGPGTQGGLTPAGAPRLLPGTPRASPRPPRPRAASSPFWQRGAPLAGAAASRELPGPPGGNAAAAAAGRGGSPAGADMAPRSASSLRPAPACSSPSSSSSAAPIRCRGRVRPGTAGGPERRARRRGPERRRLQRPPAAAPP